MKRGQTSQIVTKKIYNFLAMTILNWQNHQQTLALAGWAQCISIMSMFSLFSFTFNLSLRFEGEKKESVPLMRKMAKACHFESVFLQLVHHSP